VSEFNGAGRAWAVMRRRPRRRRRSSSSAGSRRSHKPRVVGDALPPRGSDPELPGHGTLSSYTSSPGPQGPRPSRRTNPAVRGLGFRRLLSRNYVLDPAKARPPVSHHDFRRACIPPGGRARRGSLPAGVGARSREYGPRRHGIASSREAAREAPLDFGAPRRTKRYPPPRAGGGPLRSRPVPPGGRRIKPLILPGCASMRKGDPRRHRPWMSRAEGPFRGRAAGGNRAGCQHTGPSRSGQHPGSGSAAPSTGPPSFVGGRGSSVLVVVAQRKGEGGFVP